MMNREPEAPALADAFSIFPHPQNRSLFEYLKGSCLDALNRKDNRILIGDYPFLTHPDLIERFRELVPTKDVVQGTAFGRPIMVSPKGIVFARAGGMNQIFLRLPRELQQRAIDDGGRFDPTYGEDWIEFLAFGKRYGSHASTPEALCRWMQTAYDESLKLEAKS